MTEQIKIRCAFTRMVALSQLTPHPKNRNKHPEEQIERLCELVRYQGVRKPITVSTRSGFITAGHGRLLAAQKLEMAEFPVDYQDYDSEEQEYADVQADNAIALWAEMDLAGINADLPDLGPNFNLDHLGIRNFVLEPADKLAPGCDEDHAPSAPAEPITKRGDIWKLGPHRLICGDSTCLEDVERLMAGEKADCVWTDPPYNVAYEGKTKEALTIENDSMDGESFFKFLYDAFSNMLIATKPGCSIYVAHADTEGMNFRKALAESGWLLKQCLVWVRQTFVMGRQDYHWKHEPILYGWAPGASHNWYADRKQSTVVEFDRPTKSLDHPTMKPVELIEYFLGNSCAPGGLVLDLFGGSGSTLIAAEKTRRRAFLCEIDPRYCDVIVRRWEQYSHGKAQLLTAHHPDCLTVYPDGSSGYQCVEGCRANG